MKNVQDFISEFERGNLKSRKRFGTYYSLDFENCSLLLTYKERSIALVAAVIEKRVLSQGELLLLSKFDFKHFDITTIQIVPGFDSKLIKIGKNGYILTGGFNFFGLNASPTEYFQIPITPKTHSIGFIKETPVENIRDIFEYLHEGCFLTAGENCFRRMPENFEPKDLTDLEKIILREDVRIKNGILSEHVPLSSKLQDQIDFQRKIQHKRGKIYPSLYRKPFSAVDENSIYRCEDDYFYIKGKWKINCDKIILFNFGKDFWTKYSVNDKIVGIA